MVRVGWVKQSATQHTILKPHGNNVGFRASTQPNTARLVLKTHL